MKVKFLTLFCLILLLLPLVVLADEGPKPVTKFNLIYETTKPIELISGQLLVCAESNCKDAVPLQRYQFRCSQNSCSSITYFQGPYQKLKIEFSDKTRESDIFSANVFIYDVTVTNSELIVAEGLASPSPGPRYGYISFNYFLRALVVTLMIELLIALVFLLLTKTKALRRILSLVLLVNILSLPFVWFVFPSLLKINSTYLLMVSEVFAVFFEAALIFWLSKKSISFVKSFIMSMLMNACSALLGPLLLLFIYSLNIFLVK